MDCWGGVGTEHVSDYVDASHVEGVEVVLGTNLREGEMVLL